MADGRNAEKDNDRTDQRISETVQREQSRLRIFISRRALEPREAEDILQDLLHKLVEGNYYVRNSVKHPKEVCSQVQSILAPGNAARRCLWIG